MPVPFLRDVRLSAATAFGPALQSALVSLLMIPITALLLLVLGNEERVNWGVSAAVGGTVGVLWFTALFVSTLADLRKRIDTSGKAVFPASSFYSGLYALCAVGAAWLTLQAHREKETLWMQLLPLVFVVIAFFGWPRTITCTKDAVSQRTLFGWKRLIPYAAIEAISVDSRGITSVLGAGVTIEHTEYHLDSLAFRAVVSRRSGRPVY